VLRALNVNLLGTARLLWSLIRNHRAHVLLCLGLVLLNTFLLGIVMSLVLPLVMQLFAWSQPAGASGFFAWVSETFSRILGDAENKKLLSVLAVAGLGILSAVTEFLVVYTQKGLAAKITYDCRSRLVLAIQRLQLREITRHSRGLLVQLAMREARMVFGFCEKLVSVFSASLTTLTLLALMFVLSWKLTLVVACGAPVLMCLNAVITRAIKRLAHRRISLQAKLTAQVTDEIWGAKQVKLLSAEDYVTAQTNRTSAKSLGTVRAMRILAETLPLCTRLAVGVGLMAIFAVWLSFPVFGTASDGGAARGDVNPMAGIVTFLAFLVRLGPVAGKAAQQGGLMVQYLASVERVRAFLSEDRAEEKGGSLAPEPLLRERISLHDVHMEYVPGQPVLRGATLDIEKGAYIGMRGPSGSGKSTLFALLTRLYDPTHGRVTIDGNDIQEFKLDRLRSAIGLLCQDPFLFSSTVRENLLVGKPDATEEELWTALERAGLRSFVAEQEKGLDLSVGNNGEKLSGGQQQRLSLATVFLRDPEIIILDEGTSAIDPEAERHILQSLREFHAAGKTIICSAHRGPALADAGRVYELQEGRLEPVS
jgi:ABC-type multidrug transport system fused ATPase/permease subunit